jgi:hypothetical protein
MLKEMPFMQTKIEVALQALNLTSQPQYAITGGPNCQIGPFWGKSGSRFYFLNLEAWQKLFSC